MSWSLLFCVAARLFITKFPRDVLHQKRPVFQRFLLGRCVLLHRTWCHQHRGFRGCCRGPFFFFNFFFPDGKAGRGGTELTFLGREAQRGVGWEVLARALAVQCSGRYLLPDVRWRAEGVNL